MQAVVCMARRDPPMQILSEVEFEEILQRNKTVSSSAISRAVQDASSGKLSSYMLSRLDLDHCDVLTYTSTNTHLLI